MIIAFNILIALIILIGLIFLAIAALGFIRLPDLFCRLHLTCVIDTLGAPLIMLGIALYLLTQVDVSLVEVFKGEVPLGTLVSELLPSGKLVLSIAILFYTSPLVGHFLSRAAIEVGYGAEMVQEMKDEPLKDQTIISDPTSVLDEQIVADKLIAALTDSAPGSIPAIDDDDDVDDVIKKIKEAKTKNNEEGQI